MDYREIGIKFTEEEYLSKKEIIDKNREDSFLIWQETIKYRNSFKYTLDIRGDYFDNQYLVLFDNYHIYIEEAEKLLFEYKDIVDNLYISYENVNDDFFKRGLEKELERTERDIYNSIYSPINEKYHLLFLKGKKKNENLLSIKNIIDKFSSEYIAFSIDSLLEVHSYFDNKPYRNSNNKYSRDYELIQKDLKALVNISKSTSLNALTISGIIFYELVYINPFDNFNYQMSCLFSCNKIKEVVGSLPIYSRFIHSLLYNKEYLIKEFNKYKESNDLTYFLIKYLQLLIDSLDESLEVLNPYIELKPTTKEEVFDNNEEEEVLNTVPTYKEYVKPESNRQEYDFIEDPFFEEKKDKINMRVLIDAYLDKDPSELSREMLRLDPSLKTHQAEFYSKNHEPGRFYTISNFKNECGVVYETARTSMEYLVSINLYKKIQVKNKFVYTPVNLDE